MSEDFVYPYGKELHGHALERLLPPYFSGGITAILNEDLQAEDNLFDPFGAHPLLAVEAAQAGYRVYVSNANPILNLALKIYAMAPTQADFNHALAAFSTIRRGEESLEKHLSSLYLTRCPVCKELTPASAFIWQKHAESPEKKILTCMHCRQNGEYETDAYDVEVLHSIGSTKLHQARALSSITDPDNPLWHEIESMMEIFPLRALYTIINMANRIKGNIADEQTRLLLFGLLLNFCDYGNALWDPENAHFRPKQLNVPPVYKEFNPWLLIPQWIEAWHMQDARIPVTNWPEVSESSGGSICILPYRLKESVQYIKEQSIQAVIGQVPRPSNAFWALSAFWTGWLFGKPAARNMAFAFARKRYDWRWHANVLATSFEWINQAVSPDTPRFLTASELMPGFVSAFFAAGQTAGWRPVKVSLNAQQENIYTQWDVERKSQPGLADLQVQSKITKDLVDALTNHNEPIPYLSLHTLYASNFSRLSNFIPMGKEDHSFQQLQDDLNNFLRIASPVYRIADGVKERQSGHWWLTSQSSFNNRLTFSERVEAFTHACLQQERIVSEEFFFNTASRTFPGMLSPAPSLLLDCLQAYAEKNENGYWQLSETDQPAKRNEAINEIMDRLSALGEANQFTVQREEQAVWWKKEKQNYVFYVIPNGICSPYFSQVHSGESKNTAIIFPGSKSKLVHNRLSLDPRYQKASENYHLIKFRHILRLLEPGAADIGQFLLSLDEDQPGSLDMRQMSLFS